MSNRTMKKFSGTSGQTITDRMTAAKHSISGSGLAKIVCKATTEELIPPKVKHLNYLIECTRESNISIPELANALLERLSNQNWAVVFKALVSIHHLMNYGNERFTQYLASNNCRLSLPGFLDKTSLQGADMSRFISRYSAYVQEKAMSYRTLAFDFCKVKRGAEDAALRTMSVERLLRSLPALLAQFDALLAFDATPGELSNSIINGAFMLLYKDASRLFVVFNDGIINLLTKFFEAMNKKQCREALGIYKKFLARSERLNEFSRVAESAGVERADLAVLEKHPTSFLEAMEGHLGQLDGRKISRSSSSNSVGSAAAAPASGGGSGGGASSAGALTEAQRQQLLQEEQEQLDRLKEQRQRKAESSLLFDPPAAAAAAVASSSQPTGSANSQQPQAAISFASFDSVAPSNAAPQQSSGFAAFDSAVSPVSAQPAGYPFATAAVPLSAAQPHPLQQQQQQQQIYHHHHQPQHQQQQQQPTGFDPFGSVLEPARPSQAPANHGSAGARPAITGDLDSSIATLAGSLSIKDGQFGRQGRQAGQQQQQGIAGPVRIAAGPTVNWGAPQQQQPQQQQQLQQQQQFYPSGGVGYGAQGVGYGGGMAPYQAQMSAQNPFLPAGGGWSAAQPRGAAAVTSPNDPFGAL